MCSVEEREFDLRSNGVRDVDAARHSQAGMDGIALKGFHEQLRPPFRLELQVVIADVEVVAAVFVGQQCGNIEECREGSLGNHG
jgi:hypothetical protein